MEEDIEILENFIQYNKFCKEENGKLTITIDLDVKTTLDKTIQNLITRYKQYEQKLMFALSPTTHELALETQRNFKKIIVQNIDEDTYTIRRELKKYWDNKDTYWKEE